MPKYIIIDSARRHRIPDDEMIYVIEHADEVLILNEFQNKTLYVGMSQSSRDIEAITVENVDGNLIIIHAMKLRKSTLRKIRRTIYGR
ncbi:hypothetical protein FACS1894125_6970 [Actinomycetota bacterium]|nr:hypothetical protein FACS1894125_6970 [Actinomycetota bacterium]